MQRRMWQSAPAGNIAAALRGAAMRFFLVAAGGGVWLAIDVLTSDRDPSKR